MKNFVQKKFKYMAGILFVLAFFSGNAFAAQSKSEVQFVEKLGQILENGTIQDALELYNSIPAELANDTDLMCLKASLLISCDKIQEAKILGDELLQKEPNNLDVLELCVVIAKKSKDNANKSKYLRQILQIDPKNAFANIELADEQVLKKKWRNARDYYLKALSGDKNNTEALFGYGKMCYYMEKDDDAKKAFNRLILIEPDNPQANAYLAKYEAENFQYKKALELIEKAIKADSENLDFYFDKGTYQRFSGDYKGAEATWKKAIGLEPNYFLGYAYLAGLYDELDKTEDALKYYRLTVEKNPKYYYAYESLGMFAWKIGNWEESQNAFEKALQNNPDSISYKLMICACLYKQNKMLEMRKFTENLMKKNTDRQSLDYKFIRMYHDKGGDGDVALQIQKETNRTKRGRYLFYLGLYYQLINRDTLAFKYYGELTSMESPMFFEYRLAQWATNK